MKVEARILLGLALAACSGGSSSTTPAMPASADVPPASAGLARPDEVHLRDVVQLTRDAGENAEAYWSSSGKELIFQSARPPYQCDQIFRVPADGSSEPDLVSPGGGRTTCSYFFPGDQRVLFSSTHLASAACPPVPDHSMGYVWPLYDVYDIFTAKPDGSDLQQLTTTPGYDAEATICSVDGSIIFTSTRDGDIDLYRMDKDGKNVVRLTDTPGYDGGAFFSQDCSQIVWRASRPKGADLDDFKKLLAQGLVRPSKLELFVADAAGAPLQPRQVTYLDAASFAPYFHPNGKRILFSSNHGDPKGREFDIWAINVDGSGLERITTAPGFDGFPMFSPDGTKLAFASNRNQAQDGQTDVYVASWVESPAASIETSGADRYAADVRWLADDAREGRGVGTKGIDAAADWLAAQLQGIGLEGGMEKGSFFQPLEVPVSVKVAGATSLVIDGKPVAATDFVPAGFSAQAKAAGATVAKNYGIAAKDLGHDDWGKAKATGKVVVVRRFAPIKKAFADKVQKAHHEESHRKAVLARQRGAAALVVVDAPSQGGKDQEEAALPPVLAADLSREVGIPVVFVKRAIGEKLLRGAHKVEVNVALDIEKKPTRNVVAVLRAGGSKKAGALFIGAHYDHLGHGNESSLEATQTGIHNGADDNASGTAALLEIARSLVARRGELQRDVYIVSFTAEELGLVGAKHLVGHLPPGLEKKDVAAMINLDMVGRMRDNTVLASGTGTAGEWKALVEPACAAARVECDFNNPGGWGPSDHSAFYAEKIPVLYFFTGNHDQYHKTTDDADLINAAGGARIAGIVAETALATTRAPSLTYNSIAPPTPPGERRGWRASLGTIPSYTSTKPGVTLDGVRPGGAAEKAGLRRGDRITRIADVELRSVQELVYVLEEARPGSRAVVTFERDGQVQKVEVTFAKPTRPGGGTQPTPHPK